MQYEGTVNENEVGVVVARLHVTDQDMQGSPAWRAVYRIKSGDQNGDFSITTDPKTNDGILKTAKVGPATGARCSGVSCLPASTGTTLAPLSCPPPGPGL